MKFISIDKPRQQVGKENNLSSLAAKKMNTETQRFLIFFLCISVFNQKAPFNLKHFNHPEIPASLKQFKYFQGPTMNNTSYTRLPSKRAYLINMGRILVSDYGKLAFYSPKQIEAAHEKSDWSKALPKSQYKRRGPAFFKAFSASAIVAAMSIFSVHADFDKHMLFMGTVSQYSETRSKILSEVLPDVAAESLDFLGANMDVSWLELGEGVGVVAEVAGEAANGFFGLILEGIGGVLG